jgi:hypothetical protein
MSTVILTCPIDGLGLSVATVTPKEGDRNGAVGGHIHMDVTGSVSCLNGHRWDCSGNFLLTRVP